MKHHVAAPVPGDILQSLREDPALRAIYRQKSIDELDQAIARLTNAQRNAVLTGLIRLAWVQMRRM